MNSTPQHILEALDQVDVASIKMAQANPVIDLTAQHFVMDLDPGSFSDPQNDEAL